MKNHKIKENKLDDKVTIETLPAPDAPITDTHNDYAKDSVSTNSYIPYSLINCKFAPYSTNTMKNQKKKENKIDDKVSNDTIPAPDTHGTYTPNVFAQDCGSSDYNFPYSLRNHKFAPYSTTTVKN